MSDLLLRPALGPPNKYEVVAEDGRTIGSIVLLALRRPQHRDVVNAKGATTHGFEAMREAAMQVFARSWHRE